MEMRATAAWQPAHDMMSPPIEVDISLSKRIPKTSNDLTAIVFCRRNPREWIGELSQFNQRHIM